MWKCMSLRALFSWDLQVPWPFSLFSPPNTFLSVLMLLPHLPLTCSLHLRIYDSLRPSTPLTLVLETVISWFLQTLPSDCYLILGCVAMKISGKQGSERHFLLTFIIRSPEARSFWQPSGMFILLELVSWGLMTVSFLVRFSKFRPCFSQICSCSSFIFKVFFSDCSAIPLAFLGHLNTYKNMSLWCLIGLLPPILPSNLWSYLYLFGADVMGYMTSFVNKEQ